MGGELERTEETESSWGGIAQLENFRKLLEGKAHSYAHLDMARATCLKLVMRHFAPLPTSEARR